MYGSPSKNLDKLTLLIAELPDLTLLLAKVNPFSIHYIAVTYEPIMQLELKFLKKKKEKKREFFSSSIRL